MAPGLAYVLKIRTGLLRDIGAALSPFNSQQIILGVETLPLRARKHAENAAAVAKYLSAHPLVTSVQYAGLPGHPDHANSVKYLPLGPGAVFGFGTKYLGRLTARIVRHYLPRVAALPWEWKDGDDFTEAEQRGGVTVQAQKAA